VWRIKKKGSKLSGPFLLYTGSGSGARPQAADPPSWAGDGPREFLRQIEQQDLG
jgi:hypothetical protein